MTPSYQLSLFPEKRCPKCGETQDLTAYYRDRKTRDGLCCWCKSCMAILTKASRNRMRIATAQQDPYAAGGTKMCPRCKRTLDVHAFSRSSAISDGLWSFCKDCSRTRFKEWYTTHAEWSQEHYQKNKDYYREKDREYRRADPLRVNQRKMARYARQKRGATGRPVKYAEVYARDKGICQECGIFCPVDAWHLDHYIPLILGGAHDPSNVRVLCPPCNQHKQGKMPDGTWGKLHAEEFAKAEAIYRERASARRQSLRKVCDYCGGIFAPQQRPNGVWESPGRFARRRFCGRACQCAFFRPKGVPRAARITIVGSKL